VQFKNDMLFLEGKTAWNLIVFWGVMFELYIHEISTLKNKTIAKVDHEIIATFKHKNLNYAKPFSRPKLTSQRFPRGSGRSLC
jgi:hypothetical protein